MRLTRRILLILLLLAGADSIAARQSTQQGAQPINPDVPPPPPPPEAPPTPVDQQIDPDLPPPPPPEAAKAVFDPYHAKKSLDVGTFYMRQGKYDAAIDRFKDAANYQPSLALPWRLMGEAYEKKREFPKAIESYKKYLEMFPRAPDAEKITKQISMLEEKTSKDNAR